MQTKLTPENHKINRQYTELHQDSLLAVGKHISMKQLPKTTKTEQKLITDSESLPLQLNDYATIEKLQTKLRLRSDCGCGPVARTSL